MYGFTEVRTDNERYIISSLINNFTNAPDKQWTALTINDKKEKELAYWDNPAWLKSVLLVNLERYVSGSISRKQFLTRTNTEQPKEIGTETMVTSIQEARELLELFNWARKLKMI
jgi:hypothetical protein